MSLAPVPRFTATCSPEPHVVRGALILEAHPQIQDLFGHDRAMVGWMLASVGAQFALAAAAQWLYGVVSPGLWAASVAVWVLLVGSVLSHVSAMFIHEASHDNCAPTSLENKLWALVANTSMVLPSAMSFRKYHNRHHMHLGVYGIDADLPADWEVAHLPTGRVAKAVWLLAMPFFYLARAVERSTPPHREEWANLALMLVVDALVVALLGWPALAYLVASFYVGHGFHPVAAHFLHEHYVFTEGQETNSYYGWLNRVTFNVGYHAEHHDFPGIPGTRLPQLHRLARPWYAHLRSHRSWTWVLLDFVMNQQMNWERRIVRARRRGGPVEGFGPRMENTPALLRGLQVEPEHICGLSEAVYDRWDRPYWLSQN
jgi:sphingolipid 4-desaturase/C4-monooxygenase